MELDPVENIYKGGFFKNRYRLSWRVPIVCQALIQTFDLIPGDNIIDVGCAIGDYVNWFNKHDYFSWGIEGSQAAKEFFETTNITVADLRQPLIYSLYVKFKVAFSLEVAEHIDPTFANQYVDNLIRLSDTILISAASPGQKGHGHVNCVPKSYWVQKFKLKGFKRMIGFENKWRTALIPHQSKKELSSYFKNVICFRRIN
jgi:hypothetical protein